MKIHDIKVGVKLNKFVIELDLIKEVAQIDIDCDMEFKTAKEIETTKDKTKALKRLEYFVKENSNTNIYLVSNKGFSKDYIDYITQNTNIKKKQIVVLTEHNIDGQGISGVVILAGQWFQSPLYENKGFQYWFIKNKDMLKIPLQELG
ncbi:MAG TPA: hypothetical protein VF941_07275 [Clostridia bacterium]